MKSVASGASTSTRPPGGQPRIFASRAAASVSCAPGFWPARALDLGRGEAPAGSFEARQRLDLLREDGALGRDPVEQLPQRAGDVGDLPGLLVEQLAALGCDRTH